MRPVDQHLTPDSEAGPTPKPLTDEERAGRYVHVIEPRPAPAQPVPSGLDALTPIRSLRITADDIDRAIRSLGPTGDRREAYVKVAAEAAAEALRRLAATAAPAAEEKG